MEDESANYQAAQLYIESQLRQRVPTDSKVHFGHLAAMDSMPFQLDPTRMALAQPRQRIPLPTLLVWVKRWKPVFWFRN